VRAGFVHRSENLLGLVGVVGTKVLERIEVPEPPIDEAFMHPEAIDLPTRPGMQMCQRAPIPGPTPFTINLAAYIEKITEACPLCGHDEDAEVSDNEEEEIDSTFVIAIRLLLLFS
jgi:hypothetical protein